MSQRLSRSFERLRDLVPDGVDVASLHDVVRDDLPADEDLRDLLGAAGPIDPSSERENMPRLRPILVALSARAAGADRVDGETVHAAEMLHRALQLHDLAFGRQGGKRRWLARKVVKRSVSWLAGNHLTLRALEVARHTHPEVLGEVVDTLRQFADGQEVLRELQRGAVPTVNDWRDHADAHTGALFAFCCRAGALVAGADRSRITALGRYGRHVGRLWHVAEDVSMLEHGDPGAHLVARAFAARPILPLVIAAERDPDVGPAWTELVRTPTGAAADPLAVRVAAAGGIAAAREVMATEAWSARQALGSLDDSPYRRALDRLAASLVRAGVPRAEAGVS